jgi:hypothetical protein
VDTGDTAGSATEDGCESVVGGGCLAGTTEAACPSVSFESRPPPETGEGATLVGGGCQVAPASPSLWLLLFMLWLRRGALALVGVLCLPEIAHAVDVEHLAHRDGGIPGVPDADIGEAWTSRLTVGGSASRDPVNLNTQDGIIPLVTGLQTLSLGASLNLKGWIRAGVIVPMHGLQGPMAARGLGQSEIYGVLPLSEGARGHSAVLVGIEPRLWSTPEMVGQVASTMGAVGQKSWGPVTWHGLARLRLQGEQTLPGVRWGSRLEGLTGARFQPGRLGGGLSVQASTPAVLVPLRVPEVPFEVLGFARVEGSGFALLAGVGKGLTQGLGTPASRVFATVQLSPPRRPRAKPEPVARWTVDVNSPVDLEQVWVSIDGAGAWHLDDRVGVELPPGPHLLQVTAPGHRPHQSRVVVDPGRHRTVVTLDPVILGGLHIRLLDPAGGSLAGTIRVGGEDHEVPAAGTRVDLDVGSHPLVARADGFESVLVQVQIREDAVSHRVLVLPVAPVRVEVDAAEIEETVLFSLDSAELSSDGEAWLDRLAAFLNRHPEIELVRVEGHADALGDSRYNLTLSEDRAARVVEALVARKVDPERLQSVGSGESDKAIRQVDFRVLVWNDEERSGWEGTPLILGG